MRSWRWPCGRTRCRDCGTHCPSRRGPRCSPPSSWLSSCRRPSARNPKPEYYANGPDIPRALQALQTLRLSSTRLDEELDSQLVGLARLVSDPASRAPLDGLPRVTVASDLHTNVLALPALERAANRGPLFFIGDVSDSGSPLETELVARIARAGRPFVFVAGNHDSDTLSRRLARAGAIVLTRRGRLHADGSLGPVVVRAAGMRIAGYDDPLQRRSSGGYRDNGGSASYQQQLEFLGWFDAYRDDVDAILVHSPQLAQLAIQEMRALPPERPLVMLVGHTHRPALDRVADNFTVINGGSVGGGGAANIEDESPIGIAAMTYRLQPSFEPLAADLVQIDPGNGVGDREPHAPRRPARGGGRRLGAGQLNFRLNKILATMAEAAAIPTHQAAVTQA